MAYNGWSNYETWATALWLDNDEQTYRDVQEIVTRYVDLDAEDADSNPRDEVAYRLGQRIKDYVEEQLPGRPESGLFADLATAALSEVDWAEVADHYLDA